MIRPRTVLSRAAIALALGAPLLLGPPRPALAAEPSIERAVAAPGVDPLVAGALREAYAGRLESAARVLEELAATPAPDALVLWNLAAVRARQDKLGRALFAVMRLLRRDPPAELARRAEALREKIQRRLVERARRGGDPGLFMLRDPRSVLERWSGLLAPGTWRWMAYAAFWIALSSLGLRTLTRARVRLLLTGLTVLSLCGTAVAGATDLLARHTVRQTTLGVVLERNALLRESLVKGAPTHRLPEGLVLDVRDRITDRLVQVALPDDREGYLEASSVGVLR